MIEITKQGKSYKIFFEMDWIQKNPISFDKIKTVFDVFSVWPVSIEPKVAKGFEVYTEKFSVEQAIKTVKTYSNVEPIING